VVVGVVDVGVVVGVTVDVGPSVVVVGVAVVDVVGASVVDVVGASVVVGDAWDPTCITVGTSAVAPPVPVRVIIATAPATPAKVAAPMPHRERRARIMR
jgi:hypothetical protein